MLLEVSSYVKYVPTVTQYSANIQSNVGNDYLADYHSVK